MFMDRTKLFAAFWDYDILLGKFIGHRLKGFFVCQAERSRIPFPIGAPFGFAQEDKRFSNPFNLWQTKQKNEKAVSIYFLLRDNFNRILPIKKQNF